MLNFSAIPRHAVAGRALRLPLRLIPRSLVVPILQGPLRGALDRRLCHAWLLAGML
jgi:hypothetical protein